MRCSICLAVISAALLLATVAEAAPWGRRAARRPRPAPSPTANTSYQARLAQPPARPQSQGYWSLQPELYPQWYGGFHGRMLQNYGYPPGDLGLRGMAW